jgi:hypothetical protein
LLEVRILAGQGQFPLDLYAEVKRQAAAGEGRFELPP